MSYNEVDEEVVRVGPRPHDSIYSSKYRVRDYPNPSYHPVGTHHYHPGPAEHVTMVVYETILGNRHYHGAPTEFIETNVEMSLRDAYDPYRRMAAQRTVLIALAALSCVLMQSADALTHVVGGECGWEIPPNPNFYADWAKPRTFGLGDKLVFPYRIVSHDVLQVEKDDFDTCGHKHVINQFYKGPTVIQLNNTGDYYFYSGVGTHCELGQKLHITVGTGPGSDGKFTFTPARRLLLGAAEHGDAKKDAAGEKESAAGEKESAAGEKESAAPAPGPAGEAAPAAASAAPTTAAQIFGALASCLAVLILI